MNDTLGLYMIKVLENSSKVYNRFLLTILDYNQTNFGYNNTV